jgi:ethylmalonyl-CoA mutase
VLSGSHLSVVPAVIEGLHAAELTDVPVIVGGIIPANDVQKLMDAGVAAVLTPGATADEISETMKRVIPA